MKMILGLDGVPRGPVLDRARAMGAPVLISANALAARKATPHAPVFRGFNTAPLAALDGMEAHLDSAGFVAMVKYRGFDWTVQQYVQLGAAYPWRWFASMDACVEQEVAPNRDVVLDRMAWTVALNGACRQAAQDLGCLDRLMPVIQGARPEDYLRCLDWMPYVAEAPLVGVGSMCRRHTGGLDGILACVDAIDRALGATPVRLHLFGVKSDAAEALRGHPRVASGDSQAYGVRARSAALEINRGRKGQGDLLGEGGPLRKDRAFVAGVMGGWYQRQRGRLARPGGTAAAQAALEVPGPAPRRRSGDAFARLAEQQAWSRDLLAEGEEDWEGVNPLRAWEAAACCELEPAD